MHSMDLRKQLLYLCGAAVVLLTQPRTAHAQAKNGEHGRAEQDSAQRIDADSVGTILRQLQLEVRDLNTQVATLKAQQEAAKAESAALRMELETTKSQFATAPRQPNINSISASPSPNEKPQSTTDERINKLEENQQLADAKIAEQSQTKVESASKYRLRLTGLVLFNLFGNEGTVENQDFPQLATKRGLLSNDGSFGGSLRQSQIGVQAYGPTIAGARTSANVQFDFAGGFPQSPNGVTFGIMRLRTGTIRLDWEKTSVIAGQDSLFIAPLSPTSVATLAVPALAYSGNLWSWAPQVRVEHRFTVSENSTVTLQGAILDSLSGDLPPSNYDRYPSWGEDSKQPAYAARMAWTRAVGSENVTLGVGGYYNRQFWGYGRTVDGWAGTIDMTLPLPKRFELTGQFYRGKATGGLGGGIGQTVLWNGSLLDSSTDVYGLNSLGGWAQIKYRASSKLQFNGAFGQENPFASELRDFGNNSVYYTAPIAKNQTALVNFLYQPKSDIVLSLEYRRLKTFTLDSNANTANIVNFSIGYIF